MGFPIYICPVGLRDVHFTNYSLWSPPVPSVDLGIGYGVKGPYGKGEPRIAAANEIDQYFRGAGASRLASHTKLHVGDVEQFWAVFPKGAQDQYEILKKSHDPHGAFPSLTDKLMAQ